MDVLQSWPGGDWQATARLVGTLFFSYLLLIWVTSILWVYRDIRSRSNDLVTHFIAVTLAVMFPIVGLPVYLILRPPETLNDAYDRRLEQEALLSELHALDVCPNCQYPVGEDFSVCARCGTSVRQPCGRCGRAMQLQWRHCPYCGNARVQPQPRAQSRVQSAEDDEADGAQRGGGRQAALDAIRRAATRATSEFTSSNREAPAEAPRESPQPRSTERLPPPRPRPPRAQNPRSDTER